jgi:hypothetical protein
MTPPSAAEVKSRPHKRSTRNRKMPVNSCRNRTSISRLPTAGRPPSRAKRTGRRIAAPMALLRPPARKTGRLSAMSLPATTELPTSTIAPVSSR